MNYADFGLGTWHPKGGMYKVVEAIESLALELGVTFHLNSDVQKINTVNNKVVSIEVNGITKDAAVFLSGADYHFTESLLDKPFRQYTEKYWDNKVFAPSSLLFYVGFDKKYPMLIIIHCFSMHLLFSMLRRFMILKFGPKTIILCKFPI